MLGFKGQKLIIIYTPSVLVLRRKCSLSPLLSSTIYRVGEKVTVFSEWQVYVCVAMTPTDFFSFFHGALRSQTLGIGEWRWWKREKEEGGRSYTIATLSPPEGLLN